MSPRWRDPSAFRADPAATPAERPSRRQAVALFAALLLVAGTVTAVSYAVRPEKARAFDLFHGSIYLADQTSPVGVDLASGKPTTRLVGADRQVGLSGYQDLAIVPLTDSTLLLNQDTGEFNMVDNTGFVVKRTGGGVPLGPRAGTSTSMAVDSGDGQAYILRTGATGGTDVYLVNQATVESAISATKTVTPRASTSMTDSMSTSPGAAAGADGALWLLAGAAGGSRTIREFTVPANSNPGVALHPTDHGTVSGPAAIGTAQTADGQTTVGVLSSTGLQLFTDSSGAQTVPIVAPGGLDEVLPASAQQDRLAFLLHGNGGWSLFSVEANGTGLRRVTALPDLPTQAQLAPPAYSNGNLYTIDRSSGRIYEIGLSGQVSDVAGATSYPLIQVDGHTVEPATFTDAYLIARGPRVAIDSSTHANALMLFTDGSHPPVVIQKNQAVALNAQGGAEALAATNVNPGNGNTKSTSPGSAKPQPPTQELVNPKIDCKSVQQKPLIPILNPPVPGSRSVQLTWSYTPLSTQDCYPSTYEVDVKLISNGAPQPPSSVQVQGQTGINLTGLFPSTQYQVTVTAFINGQGTASEPIQFTTGPEGPAAPTGLTVTPDNAGNWIVNWNSCGTVAQGCVPAQDWTVTPSFCDSVGVASPPSSLTRTADPTARQQGPVTYPGSDSLLGRGLQFQVTGTGTQGQVGTPSAQSGCVYSWAPPQISGGALTASLTGTTALGGTATADVSLNLGTDPVRAVGGVGATITLTLTGPDYSQIKTVIYGPGTSNPVTGRFSGLQPGQAYSAVATVSPPGHPGSAVTLPPVPVSVAAAWPAVTVTPTCQYSYILTIATDCALTVTMSGPASSQAGGETFSLTSNSGVVCGNTAGPPLSPTSGFDPSTAKITTDLSLFTYSGNCTVSLQLSEDKGTYFGGTPSPTYSATFTLGSTPTAKIAQGDMTATWSGQGGSSAEVQYNGNYTSSQLNQLTMNWQETLRAPDGSTVCGTDNEQPSKSGIFVAVSPSSCIGQFGGQGGWTVEVSYDNKDGSSGGDFTYKLSGTPPSYVPCNPAGLAAAYGKTKADGIDVSMTSQAKDIAGCSNWTYKITDSTGTTVCAASSAAVTAAPPTNISLTTCGTPPATGWQLTVSWQDTTNTAQNSGALTISGTPPTS